MTKVYISGPMTGYPDFNEYGFAEAARKLRDLGFSVVNPHELPDPVLLPDDEAYNWRQYLARDLERIVGDVGIEGIVVLPGWENSKGSRLEIRVAQYIGLKVYPLEAVLRVGAELEKGSNEK